MLGDLKEKGESETVNLRLNRFEKVMASTSAAQDELQDLMSLEQRFYQNGVHAGRPHGELHGLFEGRALGRDKAWDMWTEIGHYEGTGRLLMAMLMLQEAKDSRPATVLQQMLALIESIPLTNDSTAAVESSGSLVDIMAQLTAARSKYRTACASLGVRPRLATATEDA
ncbi:hypothetical protein OIV83_006162 [Microbotryomycetes sp. JL201]|nr:hypothetical protein OIV83_006162 [Microbotryomycetes sp. JL201]